MKKLHPRAVWLFMFSPNSMRNFIYLLPISMFILAEIFNFLHLGLFLFFSLALFISGLPLFIRAKLFYHYYKYELTENEFKKEFGIISKKYTAIPYNKIQNINIKKGIVARCLGLANLYIQTALSTDEFNKELPGLSQKDAEELCDQLIYKAKQFN